MQNLAIVGKRAGSSAAAHICIVHATKLEHAYFTAAAAAMPRYIFPLLMMSGCYTYTNNAV